MIPCADSKSPGHTVLADYNPEDGLTFSVEESVPLFELKVALVDELEV